MNKLSQINFFEGEGYKGFGKLGLENDSAWNADSVFANFISSAIGLITIIAVLWFVFILLTGAFGIITSGGDKNSLESAKKKLSSGLIGLVVVFFGIFIIRLVGYLIGIPNITHFLGLFDAITRN